MLRVNPGCWLGQQNQRLTAKMCKQPKWPSAGQWMNEIWSISEVFLANERKETLVGEPQNSSTE